jgi:hypothetical protein
VLVWVEIILAVVTILSVKVCLISVSVPNSKQQQQQQQPPPAIFLLSDWLATVAALLATSHKWGRHFPGRGVL